MMNRISFRFTEKCWRETVRDRRKTPERIDDETFDLIILDLHMPKVSGFEVMEELRSEGRRIPIIVMTGHYPVEEVSERIQGFGVGAVLRKPVMITTLLDAVNAAIGE